MARWHIGQKIKFAFYSFDVCQVKITLDGDELEWVRANVPDAKIVDGAIIGDMAWYVVLKITEFMQ